MSCFPGTFPSLPGISCDQFAGANLGSDQFFLSHCHSDHMVGLDQLCHLLKPRNAVRVNHRIYCSMISKAFIVRKYPYLDERFVKDLFEDAAVVVDVFDKANKSLYKLRVTGVPANHCPGSIMFLFEKLEGSSVTHRILYTGDFRFENRSLASIRSLHLDPSSSIPLDIDELYLDTTFCNAQYLTFPSRKDAIERIWQIVLGWVRKNGMYRNQRAKHVVLLHLPAQYGSEAILNDIYEKSGLKWRIHVSDNKFQDYLCSDDLSDCTDADPRVAQWIHACSWRGTSGGSFQQKQASKATRYHQKLPCQQGPFEVCHIRPSAMYFTQERMKDCEEQLVMRTGEAYYRVCFSSHSSMTELLHFVEYIKPKKLIPCVIPVGSSLAQVLDTFSSVLAPKSIDVHDTQELLGCLSTPSSVDDLPHSRSSSLSSPDKDILSTLSSPSESSSRKRKSTLSMDSATASGSGSADQPLQEQQQAKRSLVFLEGGGGGGCDSSDGDDDDGLSDLQCKRKLFRRSKSSKANYSMPVASSTPKKPVPNQNRRASLPHSLKIPAITITPSSPSPDPNHPDYPEFFEDRLYLETKNMSTSSPETSKDMEESGEELASLNLRLSSPEREEKSAAEESLEICFESTTRQNQPPQPQSITLSSDPSADEEEEIEESSPATDIMDSTPELEEILALATTEQERHNCLNFAKGEVRRSSKLE